MKINKKAIRLPPDGLNKQESALSCLKDSFELAQPLKNFRNIDIYLPDLETQRSIASILETIDNKIELNNRINHNLEEQAQALYKSWFVDFEPFKDGRFVESELGMIPEGWKVGKIIDLATISSGKRPRIKQANEDADYNIPIIGASGVMAYTNETLIHRDVLVTGRVGTLGIIQRLSIPCWPSDNTLLIDSEYKSFMYRALNGIDYSSLNRGSTQPLLTQGDLANVSLIIPDSETLNHFETVTGTYHMKQTLIDVENNRLRNIIDRTLPKLMSGEITC